LFGHAVSASCGLMSLDQSSRCAVEITGTTNSLTAPYLKSFEGDDHVRKPMTNDIHTGGGGSPGVSGAVRFRYERAKE